MVEYLYNAIRATAGVDNVIAAIVTEESGAPITAGVQLVLHTSDTEMITFEGDCLDNTWTFIIPAEFTKDLKRRCWYCFKHNSDQLCFKQPIYFV